MAVGTSPRQSAKRAASHSTDVHFIADLITPVSCLLVLWGVLAGGAAERRARPAALARVGPAGAPRAGRLDRAGGDRADRRPGRGPAHEQVRAPRRSARPEGRVAAAATRRQRAGRGGRGGGGGLRNGFRQILVSLGRRNQSLLHRQLRIIDTLEQQASSPAALAELFTLDHLTTRMRRHAESLTILSGAAPGRSWSGPVPSSTSCARPRPRSRTTPGSRSSPTPTRRWPRRRSPT